MTLNELVDASGMSERDFCHALCWMSLKKGGPRLTLKAFENMLEGAWKVPDGVISDAYQLVADSDYIESVINHNPNLKNISYKVWKKVLDDTE